MKCVGLLGWRARQHSVVSASLDSAMMPMPCPAGSKPDAALAKRDLFKKIINYMTIGIDMSSLFMQVMTAGMSNAEDVVLKKQLYLFICTYAV